MKNNLTEIRDIIHTRYYILDISIWLPPERANDATRLSFARVIRALLSEGEDRAKAEIPHWDGSSNHGAQQRLLDKIAVELGDLEPKSEIHIVLHKMRHLNETESPEQADGTIRAGRKIV